MDSGDDTVHHGAGGMKTVDNKAIITGITESLPNVLREVMEANMTAMEERLSTQMNTMTKRLEDKIESANVSYNERFENMETIQDGFVNRLKDYEDRLNNIESISDKLEGANELNAKLQDMLVSLAKRVANLEEERVRDKENCYVDSKIGDLTRQVGELASDVRDKRICISGIKEVKNESPKKAVVRTLKELATKYNNPTPAQAKKIQPIISEEDIDIAYRTGKKIGKNPQNIVVHLKWVQTKMRIMALKKKLMADKQTKFFISDDITFELRGLRQKMKNINEAAKKLGVESKIMGNKILLSGKMYTIADLDGLSDEILDGAAQIKEVEGGLAYRGEDAFLSNFHYAPFILDSHRFVTVEQYYQYKKCLRLGKINMAAKILRTANPLQAKSLGDKFDDTDSVEWMEDRAQCMLNGTVAKFTQNPELAKKLIDTGENGLYEATTDRYFGAGIGLGSKLWLTGNWTGENAAGKICMNVRKLLNHEIERGADLKTLGGIIIYPVSLAYIPNPIMIKSELQLDGSSSQLESELESEKGDDSNSTNGESEMEEGSENEINSQVETEKKLLENDEDRVLPMDKNEVNKQDPQNEGKGKDGAKGKKKSKSSARRSKNTKVK